MNEGNASRGAPGKVCDLQVPLEVGEPSPTLPISPCSTPHCYLRAHNLRYFRSQVAQILSEVCRAISKPKPLDVLE